jgi:uncharacterized protein YjbI with pentapeptide repeats
MKKFLTSIVLLVFCVYFVFIAGRAVEILADEMEIKQPIDKVAFKLGYHSYNKELVKKFKDGIVGKDISGIVEDEHHVYIFPNNYNGEDGIAQEEDMGPDILLPITWREFFSTITYKSKRWAYVYIEADCKLFPISFAGWEFENVDIPSGFDITDAKFFNSRINSEYHNNDFELFASTWNYKKDKMSGITLWHFDLRKASFASKNVSQMSIIGILHDKNNPNVDLFKDSLIASPNGKNHIPFGISKEQLYRTKNYRNKSMVGIKFICDNKNLVDLDLSNQDISNSVLHSTYHSSQYTKNDAPMNAVNLTDAIIKGANIKLADDTGITVEQLYSTKSYKQKDLTNITFSGFGSFLSNDSSVKKCDLSNQNLSNCKFEHIDLRGIDFTDAIITGAEFKDLSQKPEDYNVNKRMKVSIENFTADQLKSICNQLKSTWNYKTNNMTGIKLPEKIQKELDAEKQKINEIKK